MAAVFFKNYFTERYSDFDEVFLIELIMGIVVNERLSYKYKILIEETITNMLEWVEKCIFSFYLRKPIVNYRMPAYRVLLSIARFGEVVFKFGKENNHGTPRRLE